MRLQPEKITLQLRKKIHEKSYNTVLTKGSTEELFLDSYFALVMNIDTFFLLGFRANMQLLAILMSAFDKLVAKRVFFFRQFQRVPEHSTSVSDVWLCLLVLFKCI